jgi:hypothetical protein
MSKSISGLYNDTHHSVGLCQQEKFHNPVTVAPAHVPGALDRAVSHALITTEQARKLAVRLGRLSYGEMGLTPGRVSMALNKVLGHGHPALMSLENSLSQ